MNMKRKENFQWLPKELHQLKYGNHRVNHKVQFDLSKRHMKKKVQLCYLLITKGVTSSSPVPLKTRRERGEVHVKSVKSSNVLLLEWCGS
ncbi:hypothetical protein TNCV_2538321 [Trichonephila clavipes]|nr:hypothetical protein TNCV_2538321 [Trichonephila clavipes]